MLCFGEEGCFGEVRLVLAEMAVEPGEMAEPAGFGDLGR